MNKHAELLRLYNQWRRGDIEHLDFTAQEIGEAIDAVLEQHADMLAALDMLDSVSETVGQAKALAENVAWYAACKAKGEQG